jgi:hypothetical protein
MLSFCFICVFLDLELILPSPSSVSTDDLSSLGVRLKVQYVATPIFKLCCGAGAAPTCRFRSCKANYVLIVHYVS